MSGSSCSMVRGVVVVGVMVLTLATAAAYTGRDLAQAAYDQQWDTVKEILRSTNAGQDLDDMNVRAGHATAISWASRWCQADVVQQLVQAQADVNLPATGLWFGATPVMWAAEHCSTSDQATLRVLLSAGANLALTEEYGMTALHFAVLYNNPAAVPLLLGAGAPTEVQDKDGLTPAQMAREYGSDALHHFTGITATTPTTTGFTNVEAIDVTLIGGSVCFAVGYIVSLLL